MLDSLSDDTMYCVLTHIKISELSKVELVSRDIMMIIARYISYKNPVNIWKLCRNNIDTNCIIFFKDIIDAGIVFSKRQDYKFINNLNDCPFIKFTKMNCLLYNQIEILENRRFTKYGYNILVI